VRSFYPLTPYRHAGGPPIFGCIQYICMYPPPLEVVSSIRNLSLNHVVVTGHNMAEFQVALGIPKLFPSPDKFSCCATQWYRPAITPNVKSSLSSYMCMYESWGSLVDIGTSSRLDDRSSWVQFPAGAGNFSHLHHVMTDPGIHPASYPMVAGAFSLWIKRPGHEAGHSPPSSAEVKNA
jgi:hypothetical protein